MSPLASVLAASVVSFIVFQSAAQEVRVKTQTEGDGARTVDLGAPGVGVLSTLPGDRYGWCSGTSMATPHLEGGAALIKSRSPELEDARLKARILQ